MSLPRFIVQSHRAQPERLAKWLFTGTSDAGRFLSLEPGSA
jgi:hypothetical protein